MFSYGCLFLLVCLCICLVICAFVYHNLMIVGCEKSRKNTRLNRLIKKKIFFKAIKFYLSVLLFVLSF